MNMQAMMQQAQKIQKEIAKAKNEINDKEFEITKSFITVKANGKKEIIKLDINEKNINEEDIDILEDLLTVTINELFKKIDQETESKLGKYGIGSLGF